MAGELCFLLNWNDKALFTISNVTKKSKLFTMVWQQRLSKEDNLKCFTQIYVYKTYTIFK